MFLSLGICLQVLRLLIAAVGTGVPNPAGRKIPDW